MLHTGSQLGEEVHYQQVPPSGSTRVCAVMGAPNQQGKRNLLAVHQHSTVGVVCWDCPIWGGHEIRHDESEIHMTASADHYFSIIPESVLYADISHAAVRVYGVLRRHADKNNGTCHPGRKRIAEFSHMSPSHVDRAIQELISIGAVEVLHRPDPNNPKRSLTNKYRLLTPPAGGYTPLPYMGTPPPAGGEVTRVIEPESENQRTYDQLTVDQTFVTFWENYPRKVGRKKCLQWWRKHGNERIVDSLDAWRQYWEQHVTDNRYIPHPYTWLNQERWNDPAPQTSNIRTDIVLAVLNQINTQPALEAPNDPN